MPDIKAYSADNKVHVFPEGTDPNVIDRTMKRYAQTGGMEDPEAQAHQSLVDKVNDAPEARVGGPNSPKMSSNLQTQIGQVKAAPLSVGGDSLIDLARSSGVKTAAKVAGRGLVGSMIGSYAGGHIGEFVGGETGKDIGEVGGGMYGGYKGVKGAEYKLPSWLGHFSTPEPPPYEPYEGGAGKLIDRVRGGSGEPSFGKPGVDLQRGKISPVPSAPAASEPEPAAHEPYGGGSATREKLATRVRGRGEAGTPQYGRPGVDLQRGGISPVPESAPGETLTEKMGAGGGTPPKTPREPAQGRPRGLKRDKPASTGGLPSRPRTPSMQKLVDRINELKGPKGKNNMYPDPKLLDAGVGSFQPAPVDNKLINRVVNKTDISGPYSESQSGRRFPYGNNWDHIESFDAKKGPASAKISHYIGPKGESVIGLSDLYTEPPERSQGHAENLYRNIVDWASKQGVDAIRSDTVREPETSALWEKLGATKRGKFYEIRFKGGSK